LYYTFYESPLEPRHGFAQIQLTRLESGTPIKPPGINGQPNRFGPFELRPGCMHAIIDLGSHPSGAPNSAQALVAEPHQYL
jgi:hypothetical protein